MAQQNQEQVKSTIKAMNMYTWRLNRHEAEKREEIINRQIMRQQHAN